MTNITDEEQRKSIISKIITGIGENLDHENCLDFDKLK